MGVGRPEWVLGDQAEGVCGCMGGRPEWVLGDQAEGVACIIVLC